MSPDNSVLEQEQEQGLDLELELELEPESEPKLDLLVQFKHRKYLVGEKYGTQK